jgi:transposase
MNKNKYSTYEIRVRALKAVNDGMSVKDVAKAYHTHRATIYRWIECYKNGEEKGLERKPGSGRPRVFEKADTDKLISIVLKPATYFGYETDFWTCTRLYGVIEEQMSIETSRWTIWRMLRDCGLTYQKPERRYFEANKEERNNWIEKELPNICKVVKKHNAVLYFQDEANISLTAVLGKTWGIRGKTPTQEVTGKRGGISAISAVNKKGSLIFSLHEKRIASQEVIHFLEQMLLHHKRRHLVVVMDQAPPHTSKITKTFIEKQKRLHVFYLPKYSPDWNPDEKVWNHLKHQELKGHKAKTKEDLKLLAEEKLSNMANNPHQLRGIFFRCFVADLLH